MKKDILAIYPGSFDPLTNGHLDIITRAAKLFPQLTVAITKNLSKNHLFSLEDRVAMLKTACDPIFNVAVTSFSGLLVDYFVKIKADVLIRGLRAVSDFEYEFQIALMNRKLNNKVETVLLMPDQKYIFLSSSIVREIACFGGNTKDFVPPCVEKKLKEIHKKVK
jgi:pantetheine-phosphate adenylyltransferase